VPEDRVPRPSHAFGVRRVAGELEREIRLDGATHVEGAARIQRPSAVVELAGANIGCELALDLRIDLIQEMHHQDVFARNRAVGLELEAPAAVLALSLSQVGRGRRHRDAQGFLEDAGRRVKRRRHVVYPPLPKR
jgi:hypothetical protein